MHYNFGKGWNALKNLATGNGNYDFALPLLPTGHTFSYYFAAADVCGNSSTLPAGAPIEVFQFKILPSENNFFLLAYSGKQDYQNTELPVYIEQLNNNIAYDIYDWKNLPNIQFRMSFYYSGLCLHRHCKSCYLVFITEIDGLSEFGHYENPKNLFSPPMALLSANRVLLIPIL